MEFDPYAEWLKLSRGDQPLDYYTLLGLKVFETDSEVIRTAALARTQLVSCYRLGTHGDAANEILTEISRAFDVLVDSKRKSEYDAGLIASRATPDNGSAMPAPVPSDAPPPKLLANSLPVAVLIHHGSALLQPSPTSTTPYLVRRRKHRLILLLPLVLVMAIGAAYLVRHAGPETDDESLAISFPAEQRLALKPIADLSIPEGQLFRTRVETEDAELIGDVAFEFAAPPPNGAAISDHEGLVTWTPTEDQGGDSYSIRVRAREVGSDESAETEFRVIVAEVNARPVLSPLGEQRCEAGRELQFRLQASDSDLPAQVLSFEIDDAPPGHQINLETATGQVTWNPGKDIRDGVYSFRFKVTDSGQPPQSATQVVSMRVLSPPPSTMPAPTLSPPSSTEPTPPTAPKFTDAVWQNIHAQLKEYLAAAHYDLATRILDEMLQDPKNAGEKTKLLALKVDIDSVRAIHTAASQAMTEIQPGTRVFVRGIPYNLVAFDRRSGELQIELAGGSRPRNEALTELLATEIVAHAATQSPKLPKENRAYGVFLATAKRPNAKRARDLLNKAAQEGDDVAWWLAQLDPPPSDKPSKPGPAKSPPKATGPSLANVRAELMRGPLLHNAEVHCVAFSPDGTLLASGCDDRTIQIWEVPSAKQRFSLAHSSRVRSLSFSPDGRFVVAGDRRSKAMVFDLSTGQQVPSPGADADFQAPAVFSPDGKSLATAGSGGRVNLWNLTTGQLTSTLIAPGSVVWSLAFSPNGQTLAAGTDETQIQVWNAANGQILHTLSGVGNGAFSEILCLSFSKDGKGLISGGKEMICWDIATGRSVWQSRPHFWGVFAVAFHPDGDTLASTGNPGDGKHFVLSRTTTGETLGSVGGYKGAIGLAYHPGGKLFATSFLDNTVKLWDVKSGAELR